MICDRFRLQKKKQQLILKCSLNVQEKLNCNKINEIREERIANQIYTGSATSCTYIQSSSNPLEIFHYPCKSFTNFEHTLGSCTLVFKFLTCRETNNLLIKTEFYKMNKMISLFQRRWYKLKFLEELPIICKSLTKIFQKKIDLLQHQGVAAQNRTRLYNHGGCTSSVPSPGLKSYFVSFGT